MGVLHGLLVAGVIGLIAVAPCLVCALLLSADRVVEQAWALVQRLLPGPVRRWFERRAERERMRWERVDQERAGRSALGGRWSSTPTGRRWQLRRVGRGIGEVAHARTPRAVGPPIEQVAGDLRRLNRLRESVATRSRVWFVAVQEAYDEGLQVACAQLGVEEHLDELGGVDLEIERLRIEGELQQAGLVLRGAGSRRR
ncbi:hypothetical protein [Dactylosporangium sp. CA-092794]|uniref:hypothetical protein n=1 Tax=Dactylosporangium sp. CA-092794 TaxID=3239929 RepID=UPI003D8FDB93